MSLHVITFTREEHYIRKFLELPGRLYSRKELMQKPDEERQILTGTHILSHYFTVFPFLVLDENDAPVSRALLTVYPDDTDAFLGFFESEENGEASPYCLRRPRKPPEFSTAAGSWALWTLRSGSVTVLK